MKEIDKLFEDGNKNYLIIKKTIEEKVVEWFWTQGFMVPYEPYSIEQNRYPRPIKINSEPKEKKYHCQYGIDKQGNIILERNYDDFGHKETFYKIENDRIVSHYYHRDNTFINCSIYYIEKGNITKILLGRKSYKKFLYKNDILISQEYYSPNFTKPIEVQKYFYEYDGDTLIGIKTDNSSYCYRRTIGLSFEDLSAKVRKRMTTVIKNQIKNYKPKEQIFAICIFYTHHHYFEPRLLFSLESEREEENDDYQFLWSYYEHEDICKEIDCTKEDDDLFEEFQQEIIINSKDEYAVNLWLKIITDLKKDIKEFELNKTEDFVFILSDFDDIDLTDNFKKINPEKFDKFNDKLN